MTDSKLHESDRVRYTGKGLHNLSYGATGTIDGFTPNGHALVTFDGENHHRAMALTNLQSLGQVA